MDHEQKEDSGHKNDKKKTDVPAELKALLENVHKRDGSKKEFVEAVEEILHSLEPLFERDPSYIPLAERFLEPERVIRFRVAWVDDSGKTQVNRGYRIQYSSAYGPYKGGLRFHPSVNSGVLKNALTGIHMGGAKGGADFDPKGKSDSEVMRFCQQFMLELHNYIGEHRDIPAGDQGVGAREIGYLFGAYRKISGQFQAGVITGKKIICGGSYLRPEATGYGIVFIAEEALQELKKTSLKGKRCAVSGSGNVALHCAQKLVAEGAVPVTMSDSSGYVLEPDGFTKEQLEHLVQIKEVERGRIKDYCKFSKSAKFVENAKPWNCDSKYDYAIPCATQNEIDEEDAKAMLERGCQGVFEGSNMPCTAEAIKLIKNKGLLFVPAKACNAGGVAASGLEMAQASTRSQWSEQEVEDKLREIMKSILKQCTDTANEYGRPGDLQFGANVAAFIKVADAMRDQGVL